MRPLRWLLVAAFAAYAATAAADFHLFMIDEIYSNADGSVQYVVLHEPAGGADNEIYLSRAWLDSTSAAGTLHFAFPRDLPGPDPETCMGEGYGYMTCPPVRTANKRVLIATAGFAALNLVKPDYVVPNGFLATGGGTLDYAGRDIWIYPALPTDGVNALYRTGTSGPNLATNFAGATAAVAPTVAAIEYHHADWDHYFITPDATEIAVLDAHTPPFQAWSRTGLSFNVYVNAGAPAASAAICRFFNSSFAPKSSHFYAPHGLGCEDTLSGFPDWGLENDKLFNAMLPDATTGACPAGTIPVYRLYNNGMGGAPNHRFVTSLDEQQRMLDRGFVAEGVRMCVPG